MIAHLVSLTLPTADAGTATDAATAAAPPGPKPAPVLTCKEGILTPESVLYDAEADRYLVSNINGNPLEHDKNGYISELSPEGKVVKEKFIDGLDAPKGSGLQGGVFYVADIDKVRMFDAKT